MGLAVQYLEACFLKYLQTAANHKHLLRNAITGEQWSAVYARLYIIQGGDR